MKTKNCECAWLAATIHTHWFPVQRIAKPECTVPCQVRVRVSQHSNEARRYSDNGCVEIVASKLPNKFDLAIDGWTEAG